MLGAVSFITINGIVAASMEEESEDSDNRTHRSVRPLNMAMQRLVSAVGFDVGSDPAEDPARNEPSSSTDIELASDLEDAHDEAPTAATAVYSPKENSPGSVAMSIWLGLMMDGVPEAIVIGLFANNNSMSVALIVGVFCANFPGGIATACMMRKGGMPWCTHTLITNPDT